MTIHLFLDVDTGTKSSNNFNLGHSVGPTTLIHKVKKKQEKLKIAPTTVGTSLRQSCCVFCSQAKFKSPLTETVRRNCIQVLCWPCDRADRTQRHCDQETVKKGDPGAVQAEVRRYSYGEQEEHSQEQQERGPCAQEDLCSLMDDTSPAVGSLFCSGFLFWGRVS